MRAVLVWCVAVIAGFGFQLSQTIAESRLSDVELSKALVGGGYVVVMRHAAADPDKADTDPLNFKSVRRQQPLSEGGKASAKSFGVALRTLGISFSEIFTSRFNRCVQTALLAGLSDVKAQMSLTEGSLVASPNENRRRAASLRALISQPLPPGQNRLIISHRANIEQALGKEWYDVKEGEASVFSLSAGAYTLVARVQIDEWDRIAAKSRR